MTTTDPAPDPSTVSSADEQHLIRAVAIAADAREHGNHPFGSLLVTATGEIVEAENTVVTETDPTGHAETNLVRRVAHLGREVLADSVLYTSCEPCVMCAGAIYWAGIGRVVFALSEDGLGRIVAETSDEPMLDLPCREVFARGGGTVAVAGPALVEAAAEVHRRFWV